MMKKFIPLIPILLLNMSVYAQHFSVQWDSASRKKSEFSMSLAGIDSSKDEFFTIAVHDEQYYFQKYSGGDLILEKALDMEAFKNEWGKEATLLDVAMLRDRIVLFMVCNGRKDKMTLFLQDLSFDGNYISVPRRTAVANGRYRGSFHLAVSKDLNHIASCLIEVKQKGIETGKIILTTFDNNLRETASREIPITTLDSKQIASVDKVLVNNAGDLYFLISNRTSLKGRYHYTPTLLYLRKNTDSPVLLSLKTNAEQITKFDLTENTIGDIIIEGFYGERNSKFYTGYFYGIVNARMQSIYVTESLLPAQVQRPPYDTDGYQPNWTIIQKDDGGQLWVFEYIWMKSNNFHFGNMFVMSLSKDGSMIYCTAVSKNQGKFLGAFRSKDFAGYYSYLAKYDNPTGALSLLFNDHPDNMHVTNEGASPLVAIKNRLLVAVNIDSSGNESKSVVESTNNDVIFCTGLQIPTKNKGSIVVGLGEDDRFFLGRLRRLP